MGRIKGKHHPRKGKINLHRIVQFRGHSGCNIELLTNGAKRFVRKISFDKTYNERLRRQGDVLRQLSQIRNNLFRVPEIYNEGYMHGKYFYDMQFIGNTQNAFFYLENCHPNEAISFCDKVFDIIKLFSINRSERSNLFLANFQKLNDLSHKIKKLNFKDLTKCIEYLISDIKRIEQLSELEQTLSHGDLTLDNILIDTNHEIWLVDSLDNDSPHYFYDIAKLYQDLEGHWGYLYNFIPFNPISNVALCHELLTEKIRKTFKLYSKYHYYFLGLTFLRIVPYVLRSPILEPVKERALRFLDNFMKGAEL